MELALRNHDENIYPACGFFVEGADLTGWIAAVDRLKLDPAEIEVFGLPSRVANELWGCLVVTTTEVPPAKLGPLASAHVAGDRLLVPEKSRLVPELTAYDWEQLFRDDRYVLHPDFGLVKLTDPLDLSDCLAVDEATILQSIRPADHAATTGEIVAFSIESSPMEDIILELEPKADRKKFDNTPLSLSEKLRLKLYKSLMTPTEGEGGNAELNATGEKLRRLAEKMGLSGPEAHVRILEDYENLRERNKKEVDKLLGLLEKDPEAALRYAIPLDEHGYMRGTSQVAFKMEDKGMDFSLFSTRRGGAGGSVNLGDEFIRSRTQYLAAAQRLEKEQNHEKAAYIYLKLLKDYAAAGRTLREGRHYEKAAVVYLKYLKDEAKAAECYEAGNMYGEAVDLYAKLNRWEKAGDLHVLLGDYSAANEAYQRQVEKELASNNYVRAARLNKEKMHDLPHAQTLLLQGWDAGIDAYNCLRYYLTNIPDGKAAWRALQEISANRVDTHNDVVFLKILASEHQKQDENADRIKDMAYELLSGLLTDGKVSAQELLAFSGGNPRMRADALRYELGRQRRL